MASLARASLARAALAVLLSCSSAAAQACASCTWVGLCIDVPECAVGGTSGCEAGVTAISESATSPTSYSSCKSRCETDADCTGFSHHSSNHCKTHHGAQVRWAQPTFQLYTCYQLSRTIGCTDEGESSTCPTHYCADQNGDYTTDDSYDCSSHANSIDTSASCAADPCTDAECCTVAPPQRTCADVNADGTADDSYDCSSHANSIDTSAPCAVDPCTDAECCTAVPCNVPSTAGYLFSGATAAAGGTPVLTIGSFDVLASSITCAAGYAGTVTVTECGSAGAAYTVSGCNALGTLCTRPSSLLGYVLTSVTETELAAPMFDVTGIACDTTAGYTGTAAAAVCGSDAGDRSDYWATGCIARTCADANADGTSDDPHDCSSHANTIDHDSAGIQCAGSSCTDAECCTVACECDSSLWAADDCVYSLGGGGTRNDWEYQLIDIGSTDTPEECTALVRSLHPTANGATWQGPFVPAPTQKSVCPTFSTGDGKGGTEKSVGPAADSAACAALVQMNEPTANGATYSTSGTSCYAEFGMTHQTTSSRYMTCTFDAPPRTCTDINADGILDDPHDCSNDANLVDLSALCAADPCTDAECCTVTPTPRRCTAEFGMIQKNGDQNTQTCVMNAACMLTKCEHATESVCLAAAGTCSDTTLTTESACLECQAFPIGAEVRALYRPPLGNSAFYPKLHSRWYDATVAEVIGDGASYVLDWNDTALTTSQWPTHLYGALNPTICRTQPATNVHTRSGQSCLTSGTCFDGVATNENSCVDAWLAGRTCPTGSTCPPTHYESDPSWPSRQDAWTPTNTWTSRNKWAINTNGHRAWYYCECAGCPTDPANRVNPPSPPNVDCAGTWSACSTDCEPAADRTWTETTAQAGTGDACPEAVDCADGDDVCGRCPGSTASNTVTSVDCVGTWSACTAACEVAALRTWVETTAQCGNGSACPDAAGSEGFRSGGRLESGWTSQSDCTAGDDACVAAPPAGTAKALVRDDAAEAEGGGMGSGVIILIILLILLILAAIALCYWLWTKRQAGDGDEPRAKVAELAEITPAP